MRLSTVHRAISRSAARSSARAAAGRWDGISDPANRQPAIVQIDAERAKKDAKNARERARRAAQKASKLAA